MIFILFSCKMIVIIVLVSLTIYTIWNQAEYTTMSAPNTDNLSADIFEHFKNDARLLRHSRYTIQCYQCSLQQLHTYLFTQYYQYYNYLQYVLPFNVRMQHLVALQHCQNQYDAFVQEVCFLRQELRNMETIHRLFYGRGLYN